jgi:two-component system capsular synthesis sensor histidine kinase RcsC
LINLLGNAIKFTEQGVINLRVSAMSGAAFAAMRRFSTEDVSGDGAGVAFAVRDSGIGIEKDDLVRLFRPFSQVESGLSRKVGGTGLGLAICARLASMMGGALNVEGWPGKGSEFILWLPVLAGDIAIHKAGDKADDKTGKKNA